MKLLYKLFLLIGLLNIGLGFMVKAQNNEQTRIYSTNGDKKLVAYPIPANNVVYLKLSQNLRNEAKTVELVSAIGRTVAVQKVNNAESDDIVFSNLYQIPEGVYIAVVKGTDGKLLQTSKLIIQR